MYINKDVLNYYYIDFVFFEYYYYGVCNLDYSFGSMVLLKCLVCLNGWDLKYD